MEKQDKQNQSKQNQSKQNHDISHTLDFSHLEGKIVKGIGYYGDVELKVVGVDYDIGITLAFWFPDAKEDAEDEQEQTNAYWHKKESVCYNGESSPHGHHEIHRKHYNLCFYGTVAMLEAGIFDLALAKTYAEGRVSKSFGNLSCGFSG